MRGVPVPLFQQAIKALLGLGQRRWNREAEAAQPLGPDRDQKRFDRLESPFEILYPTLDEIFTWQTAELERFAHGLHGSPWSVKGEEA